MVLNTILKNIVKIGLIFFWLLIINGRGTLGTYGQDRRPEGRIDSTAG